jgi:hypothetical protein
VAVSRSNLGNVSLRYRTLLCGLALAWTPCRLGRCRRLVFHAGRHPRRSLGVGMQVSAQSWQGLGRDDAERRRICATADGGIWLMPPASSTPGPLTPASPARKPPRSWTSAAPAFVSIV